MPLSSQSGIRQMGPRMLPFLTGETSTSATGYVRIGSLAFDKGNYVYSSIILEGLLETTDVANAAQMRLYDVANAAVIGTDPLLTSTSLTAEYLYSADLTLPSGFTIYELQMKMGAGAAPDVVICTHAQLLMNWGG